MHKHTTATVAVAMIATTSESAEAFMETPSIVIQTTTKRIQILPFATEKMVAQSRSTCSSQAENASFDQNKKGILRYHLLFWLHTHTHTHTRWSRNVMFSERCRIGHHFDCYTVKHLHCATYIRDECSPHLHRICMVFAAPWIP